MEAAAPVQQVAAGTLAGIAQCVCGHPFDTLKVRLQTQPARFGGVLDCARQTVAGGGVAALFRGVQSPLLGCAALNAVQFAAFAQTSAALRSARDGAELTLPHKFLCGAVTGVAAALVESPIDLLKCQMQAQLGGGGGVGAAAAAGRQGGGARLGGVLDAAVMVTASGGVRGLYQGFSATLLRNVPSLSLYFGAYHTSSTLLHADAFTSGGIAGLCFWLFTYPLDVVKTAMQTDRVHKAERRFGGVAACARALYANAGIARFYRGFSACLLRAVPANAACFLAYEHALRILAA